MNLPYEWRLGWMALASFFLLNLVLAGSVYLISPWALRWASRLRARHGARLLLSLRMAPASIALVVVAGLCVPSWIQFEPRQSKEEVGLVFLVGGSLGAAILVLALLRAAQRLWWSLDFLRRCRRATLDDSSDVWVIESTVPMMAVAGILRPRIIVSRSVCRSLEADEMAAAVGHERAHSEARDNLKRLLVSSAPGILPGINGFSALEVGWERITEWAADDRAVSGDRHRSLSLAAALVRVARMGGFAPAPGLATAGAPTLMGQHTDLEQRVDRLLEDPPVLQEAPVGGLALVGTVILCLGILATEPGALEWVHRILEDLVD